jgi:DNA polymerase III epsilon subunit-like protein
MIIIDIETTGVNFWENGILSIGALCFNHPEKQFYGECRVDEDDIITEDALKINGFSKEEITNEKKQTQKELVKKFFEWLEKQEIKILAGHNVGFFDLNFLKTKAKKYNIPLKMRFRSLDLCSVAQTKYFQINGKFLLDDYKENAMSLPEVLKFCGIKDERIEIRNKELIKQRKTHNALEDCKLEAECFSRLLSGKGLFEEYNKFLIPNYLKNKKV